VAERQLPCSPAAEYPNHVWSRDFVHDRAHDARASRVLTLLDEFTRDSLATKLRRRFCGSGVMETLFEVMIVYGIPEHVRSGNGSAITSKFVPRWLGSVGSQNLFIEPGSSWENGHNEISNGKLRDELRNGEIFYGLKEGK
jgi:putative transposase